MVSPAPWSSLDDPALVLGWSCSSNADDPSADHHFLQSDFCQLLFGTLFGTKFSSSLTQLPTSGAVGWWPTASSWS